MAATATIAKYALTTLPKARTGGPLKPALCFSEQHTAARRLVDANYLGTARPHDIEKPP